jgi:hypothetical protein
MARVIVLLLPCLRKSPNKCNEIVFILVVPTRSKLSVLWLALHLSTDQRAFYNGCGGAVVTGSLRRTCSMRAVKNQNLITLKREPIYSSETSVMLTRATRRHIQEDNVLKKYSAARA